ncbi:hypothetical protein K469DRAFT_730900 [Zopfia rhizophila CBS 207.26]|uniref:Alpha/beta-hydrolase n=1 Tax=Zopfia rhizophila CBS 207.26 TaxID=1314779 RepID=A0A6A6ENL0_9PEZI|nr:hypothetical protein K469DRAFT_730900 [Zopfia rhizophila CBS 207.26]
MHHPPEPHYNFTIPSIHDDTTLVCRMYHPALLSKPRSQDAGGESKKWKKKGIIVAHPYAPMGGSYDDRVVGIIADEFLGLGYVVGTFNFRGAHGSKGRTSWTGKPELDDYISFAVFFMHYLSFLRPFPSPDANFTPDQSLISSQKHKDSFGSIEEAKKTHVVLGGYSYGSLILKHLPPLPSILQPFSAPTEGTAASEIILRAHKLADQSNLEWINWTRNSERGKNKKCHNHAPSVTMGGEETSPDVRLSSREIRRSMEGSRSLDLGTRVRSLSYRRRKDEHPSTPPDANEMQFGVQVPEIRYLLVSPLLPPLSTLAATGLGHKFWNKSHAKEHHEILTTHATLAVFGGQDMFTSAKKVLTWAERLGKGSGGRFTYAEIAGAGHFWHEHGVEEKLRDTLKSWASEAAL